jgi:hypothetical protein
MTGTIGEMLFKLTLIQFWWISIWGLAYMCISTIAGTSKAVEFSIYVTLLLFTMVVIHMNPKLLEKL